jgi:hypothetical protein
MSDQTGVKSAGWEKRIAQLNKVTSSNELDSLSTNSPVIAHPSVKAFNPTLAGFGREIGKQLAQQH